VICTGRFRFRCARYGCPQRSVVRLLPVTTSCDTHEVQDRERGVAEIPDDLRVLLPPHRQALVNEFPHDEQAVVAAALLDLQLHVDTADYEEPM
jgi:hypothetical protein